MEQLSEQKLSELSDKWLKGTITVDELALLDAWYKNNQPDNISWTAGDLNEEQLEERLFYNIDSNISSGRRRGYFLTAKTRYATAASVALLLSATIGYMAVKTPVAKQNSTAQISAVNDGGSYNKAVLTLADGHSMQLDDAANGVIARDGGANIRKTGDGELAYNTNGTDSEEEPASINMLRTPAGGQYHISLPDGSKVWLNALTTLKFPTVFKGRERVVELTGEAYFEVAKDKSMPFRVKMPDKTSVAVLGTHFNISAYPAEHRVSATLLEGSISVQKGSLSEKVLPGEMADVTDKIALRKVNGDDVISWKHGLFRFEKADVQTVMNEIARWYNVEVIYEEGMPDNEITGFMSRTSRLSEVIKMLELSGLKLKTEGNKIIVFNN